MDLIHNQVIKIISGEHVGLYRIVLNEKLQDLLIVAQINSPTSDDSTNKKEITTTPKCYLNNLIWLKQSEVLGLESQGLVIHIDIRLSAIQLNPIMNNSSKERFDKRVQTMGGFLNFENFRHRVLMDGNLGKLTHEAMAKTNCSKPYVYKLISLLCRFGFTENALKPEYHNCGARGVLRPCGPKQKKAGAKTTQEKIAKITGEIPQDVQPGMTEEWKRAILAGDSTIPLPKPSMPTRSKIILNSAFLKDYVYSNGQLHPENLKLGTYPNIRQISRVLKESYSSLDHFLHKTTSNHFTANNRGLVGRNWEGVSGPGHTYAIDSTVGDIYLRSSLNPDWIVGRPIVYVIVDVWSTAVVGFYVCLTGPSWDMAKIALFCTYSNPELISKLRGVNLQQTLFPHPTPSAVILCDRGEYLSRGASLTGASLQLINMSYTPPYRGDYKGVVEVLHRIEKNEQFMFVPGSIDARRKEYELRKFDSKTSLLTVREYTQYLNSVFNEYNLCADRSHRVDAHMKATDVHPSPAGLWMWGHSVGIGTQLYKDPSELITSLLPCAHARVTRNGLIFDRLHYTNRTQSESEDAALARNVGGWEKQVYFYPGSLSKIWTPQSNNNGMTELELSDLSVASPEISKDEYDDSHAYHLEKNAQRNHENLLISLGQRQQRQLLVNEAIEKKAKRVPTFTDSNPSMLQARKMEKDLDLRVHQEIPIIAPPVIQNESVIKLHTTNLHSLLNPQKKEVDNG